MDYLELFKEMLFLRGLTDHTVKSYSTYIRAFLEYNDSHLHKQLSDVTYDDLRSFIKFLQADRNLADRTVNAAISQLRFFFIYVLHVKAISSPLHPALFMWIPDAVALVLGLVFVWRMRK